MEVIKTTSLLTWRHALWTIAIVFVTIVAAFAAVFATWFMVAGSRGGLNAVLRFVRYGSTTIEDFKHYPARRLRPSSSPFRFPQRPDRQFALKTVPITKTDGKRLQDLLIASETIAFLFIKNDAIVFEHYDRGRTAASLSQYFSVSKSITSVLIGAAVDDGIIRSVEQEVVDFVPEYSGRGFDGVTIRRLLTMTSGINYVEDDNPFGLHVPFNYTSEIERMMLAFKMEGKPGAEFSYKSGDVGVLSLALSRALAPKTITAYAQERLWTPLGMEHEGIWSLDRDNGLEKA